MSSGRIVDELTYKRGHQGGIGKIRCPKCQDYATRRNVNGEMVYSCRRCGTNFRTSSS